jgi:hypothetical protein
MARRRSDKAAAFLRALHGFRFRSRRSCAPCRGAHPPLVAHRTRIFGSESPGRRRCAPLRSPNASTIGRFRQHRAAAFGAAPLCVGGITRRQHLAAASAHFGSARTPVAALVVAPRYSAARALASARFQNALAVLKSSPLVPFHNRFGG